MNTPDIEARELKPCPFCGYEPVMIDHYDAALDFGSRRKPVPGVVCLKCRTKGRAFEDDPDAATAAWNTRAPTGGEEAAVREFIEKCHEAYRVATGFHYLWQDGMQKVFCEMFGHDMNEDA